jgi:hypothetical protein
MNYKKRPCNADDCDNWIKNPDICQKCIDEKFEIELFVGRMSNLKKLPTRKPLVRQYRKNRDSQ